MASQNSWWWTAISVMIKAAEAANSAKSQPHAVRYSTWTREGEAMSEYERPTIESTESVEALLTWYCKDDDKNGGGHHS